MDRKLLILTIPEMHPTTLKMFKVVETCPKLILKLACKILSAQFLRWRERRTVCMEAKVKLTTL
jgi:hypothetical protein